jgi:hypothetical protein
LLFGLPFLGFNTVASSQESLYGDDAMVSEESPLVLRPAGPDVADREVPAYLEERELESEPTAPAPATEKLSISEISTLDDFNTSTLAEAIIEVYNEVVELDSIVFGFGDEGIDYPHAASIILRDLKRALYEINMPDVIADRDAGIARVKPSLTPLAERIRAGLIKDPEVADQIASKIVLIVGP